MKNPFRSLPLLFLALTLPSHGLAPGDAVTIEAITEADFIQGEAPENWAKDELYIFECWATWCGPCIRVIPHMDELHDRHHEKGLNIIGMNVFEDGREKVAEFVTKKGEGMSYPVAYVGRGGAFEKSWLKPAGVTAIPRALVVKNGKLLFSAHPSMLTEETVATLLAGGKAADSLLSEIQQREGAKLRTDQQLRAYQKAMLAGDLDGMVAARDELAELTPEANYLSGMDLDIMLTRKDWSAAEAYLKKAEDPKAAAIYARKISFKIDGFVEGVAPSLRKAIIKEIEGQSKLQVFDRPIIARLQWDLGEKETALATAREALDSGGPLPGEVMEAYVAGFESGQPQTFAELQKAVADFRRAQTETDVAK